MIKYVSTKGGISPVNFDEAVLQGFAEDGGLFVPDTIPVVSQEQMEQWANLDTLISLLRFYLFLLTET